MKCVTRALIVTAALCVLVHGVVATVGGGAAAQRQRRRPSRPRTADTPAIDYSKFLHSTKKHQAACVTCHKIPTSNWQAVREYPDVADYPDHDACVSCHRPQFFRGARPAICSVCHSKVSPRDDERFAFRNPAGRRQFLIEFPHDKHQDVIAQLFPPSDRPRFLQASFTASSFKVQDQAKRYNNCEICHGPRATPAAAPDLRWIDGFVPDNLTLKSVPKNHAACFSCHWKSEQPVNENCAGCHKLPDPPEMIAVADMPARKSMKFRHGNDKHVEECTTCHINITKAATLRGLKPDVPITACSRCHNNEPTHVEISNELVAIDKNREFVCVYCHTSDVGRRDPPASHYLSVERPPIKRKDVK